MDSLLKRYASALLSIAKEEHKNDEYREYVKGMIVALEENLEFIAILSSEFIDKNEKIALVDKVFADCPYENLLNFIKVTIDNRREKLLIGFLKEFVSLSNEASQIAEGYVYSTVKLSKSQMDDLEKAIGQRLQIQVSLINKIDEELIGGVKVIIKDYVFDGSLKNKLELLKNDLLERNVD